MSKKRKNVGIKHVWNISIVNMYSASGIRATLVVTFSVAGDFHTVEFPLQAGYTMDSVEKLLKLHGFEWK